MTENMRELKIFQFTMRGFANGGPVCDESLFVGPVVCFNHNNGFVGPHASALCLTDAQMAAGMSEDLIFEAVCEIVDGRQGRPVETLSIMSACQSDFVGIDFDSVTRRVRDELGIACVHVKNCRIMLKGHRDRGLVRGAARSTSVTESLFELGLSWEALRRGVPAEVDEGNEVLLLSGGAPFAPDNELLGALRDWGFTRVQTVGDWRSREGLARIRDLDWVLAAGEGAAPFARHVAQSLDVPMSAFSPTYRLSEVDAVYEELNERFGVKADVADARAAAEAAIELALSATEGVCAELDLMGFAYPWRTAHALYDMGFRFDALNIGWRRGPQPPFDMEEDDDYERFVKAYPEAADRVVNMTHEDRRHLFTPNPLAGPPRMAPVSERQFFGYRLIRACMERIVEEASREMSRENVSPTHFPRLPVAR